jgi:transposase-like protein
MRYADGGGLTMEGRSRREQVRLQAAEMFEQDADARQIAKSLRVSTKSVCQWRRGSGRDHRPGPRHRRR